MKFPITHDELLTRIGAYCDATGTSVTRFGWDVAKDPKLVSDIKNGRNLGMKLVSAILEKTEAAAQ